MSSGGFRLPDGYVLNPDASLLRLKRWQALTAGQGRGFHPLPGSGDCQAAEGGAEVRPPPLS